MPQVLSSPTRSVLLDSAGNPQEVPCDTTPTFSFTVQDNDGNALADTDLTTLTLDLYEDDTAGTTVNSVSGVDILNTGRGTVSSAGAGTVQLTVLDTAIVNGGADTEVRIARVNWTWSSGAEASWHEIQFTIKNKGNA